MISTTMEPGLPTLVVRIRWVISVLRIVAQCMGQIVLLLSPRILLVSSLDLITFNTYLAFTGTAVRVYGSTQIRNNSGEIDPQWECFVDQVSIGSAKPFAYPENNWLFCSQGNLTDGLHAISVNATISTGRTFWFDRIEYAPSTRLSLSNKAIRVDNSDPELQYGPGWSSFGGVANGTQRSGSIFTFNFYGMWL